MKVAIVDYGMSNLHSVLKAVHAASVLGDERGKVIEIGLAQTPEQIQTADCIIFPGQGAMRDCMAHLRHSGLADALLDAASKKPFMGICMGMEMLFADSEEGQQQQQKQLGLNYFSAPVVHFQTAYRHQPNEQQANLKIPHVGWNKVSWRIPTTHQRLRNNLGDYFYFLHSYCVLPPLSPLPPNHADWVVGTATHGVAFVAAVLQDYVFATQFHPEKSGQAGLQLLHNFLQWRP